MGAFAELMRPRKFISGYTGAVIEVHKSPGPEDKFPAEPLSGPQFIDVISQAMVTPAHEVHIYTDGSGLLIGERTGDRIIYKAVPALSLIRPVVFESIRPKTIALPVRNTPQPSAACLREALAA